MACRRLRLHLLRAAGEFPKEDQVAAATLGTTQPRHDAATDTASRQFPPLAAWVLGVASRRS